MAGEALEVRWLWAVLDVPEPELETGVAFWAAATGTTASARRGSRRERVRLQAADSDPHLLLQAVAGSGGVQVDLAVNDLSHATEVARSQGAMVLREHGDVAVLESPGGFAFCLVRWEGQQRVAPPVRRGSGGSLLDQVCLDIPANRYAAELAFWSGLTGWEPRPGDLDEFQHLRRPPSLPLRLLLQRLDEPDGQVRAHVDFACSDRRGETQRHEALGAGVIREQAVWTVLRPPAGAPYCLTDRDPGTGRTA